VTLQCDAMCNRYTPSDREDPYFKTWLALHPTNYPPPSWRKIGPFGMGAFFHPTGTGKEVSQSVGQWGLIRPGNPRRWDYGKPRPNAKPGSEPPKRNTNNARSETMATLATYKKAWADGTRCIIPAASFDEPNWESGKNVWWEIKRADGNPWGIAGLYNEWADPASGELLPSYTMVTCNADHHQLMNRMHKPEYDKDGNLLDPQDKRSIVPLDPADWDAWLFGSKDEAWELIKLPPVDIYNAGPEETRRLPVEGSPLRSHEPQCGLF